MKTRNKIVDLKCCLATNPIKIDRVIAKISIMEHQDYTPCKGGINKFSFTLENSVKSMDRDCSDARQHQPAF